MENAKYYVAIDLGATSGRTILGTLSADGRLTTEEVTRFPNQMLDINGHLYWNIYSLYENIVEGLRQVAARGVKPESVGIDTWGVDVVTVAPDGKIIGVPNAYRDKDTFNAAADFFANVMSADELYAATGIQHMDFNTIFQLYRHHADWDFTNAESILFMPDALSYMLTGKKVTEYTIASTGAILDPASRKINARLLEAVGVDAAKFAPVVEPGTVIGTLLPEIAALTGIGELPVIAVAGHDSASAIAPIPAKSPNFAYLSSGTWSLMGVETAGPVINEITARENITNEGGVFGTIRLLKNITGMWVVEQCLKQWKREGVTYTYPEMVELARKAPAFKAFIDTDAPCFVSPADMPAAIVEYCRTTGQEAPATHGEFIHIIFESLAMKYRYILDMFARVADHPIEALHVIGGGSRNALLNQFTADAIAKPVIAGPAEASAIGNIMMQVGHESLRALRDMVIPNVETVTYTPVDTAAWDAAYPRYLAAIGK
ncbi:MAG: rhamnulokinase [Muribaculaceae bacterium]|nr:rhamnulokinase [Muribaculaceae bacterium]